MLNPYHEAIDIMGIMDLQRVQYQNALYLEQVVPANSRVDANVNITALGAFMLLSMTGDFTTNIDNEGDAFDDGINHITMQMVDGSNQRTLFQNEVPVNLFLSPGRRKSDATAITADNRGEPLFLEFPFIYTFPVNGTIQCRLNNASDFDNTIRIMFKGIRIFPTNRINS